jgi:amino acid transporter
MSESATERGHIGLMANAIGLWGDFVVSIANAAPSSSVAFTLALLLAAAGHVSPLAVLIVGVAMFLVSMGYASLNRWKAHAGAPYVWVGEAVSPSAGVGTGLLNVLVDVLGNLSNITLAGVYLLFVIAPSTTFSKLVTWLVAAAIMAALCWVSVLGLRPSVKVQVTFIFIEYAAMISFVILALIHEASGAGGATLPSPSDFTVGNAVHGIGGIKGLAEAAVPAAFLYIGWEATSVLGEESTHRNVNPGRAMMMGTLFLTIWYTFLILVFEGVSSHADIIAHGADDLAYAGQLLVPGVLGRALPIAVLVAVLGTTQIELVEPSRVIYAMARDRLMPRLLGQLGRVHQTPVVALIILAVIPPALLIVYLTSSTANHVIGDIVGSEGLVALFMYFMIAASSVWFYRARLRGSIGNLLLLGALPLIGGLFMAVIFFYGLTTETAVIAWVAVGGLVLVYALGFIMRKAVPSSPFFVALAQRKNAHRTPAASSAEPSDLG